jgi:hypothetical protein
MKRINKHFQWNRPDSLPDLWSASKYAFDGTNDYMVVSNNSDMNGITNKMSIVMWCQFESTNANYSAFIGYGDDTDLGFQIGKYSGNIEIQWGDSIDAVYRTVTSLDDAADFMDNYGMLTIVYDGSVPSIKAYWNATEYTVSGGLGTIPSTMLNKTLVDLFIMRGHNGSNGAVYAEGEVGAVGIYDVALTGTQITDLYNSGNGTDLADESGLVAYYLMGDNTHTFPTVEDETVNNNDGTLTNMDSGDIETAPNGSAPFNRILPNPIPIYSTKSISFDGIADYAADTTTPTQSLDAFTALSMSAWVKRASSKKQYVFSYGEEGADEGFELFITTNDEVCFRVSDDATYGSQVHRARHSNSTIDTGWHHIGATYNAGTIRIYIDGVYQSSTTLSESGTVTTTATVGSYENTPIIGATYTYSSGRLYKDFFDGNIDEIAIWNTVLTDANMTSLYGTGAVIDSTTIGSPICRYVMGDDDVYATLADTEGGNDLTSVGLIAGSISTDVPS